MWYVATANRVMDISTEYSGNERACVRCVRLSITEIWVARSFSDAYLLDSSHIYAYSPYSIACITCQPYNDGSCNISFQFL